MTIKKWFLLSVFLSLTSCAMFQSGSSFNPVQVNLSSSITLKAGSSTSLRVMAGDARSLNLTPAVVLNQLSSRLSLTGRSFESVYLGIAQLSNASLPQGWKLEVAGDSVNVTATSNSIVTGIDTISTQTRVELGDYSFQARLDIPNGTLIGATYPVQARIDVRGANPVMLNWNVQIAP